LFRMTGMQVNALEQLAATFDFGHGARHSRKVSQLATSLFDQLSFGGLIPALMPEDRRLLTAAGFVHDIGASAVAHHVFSAITEEQRPSQHRKESHNVLSCQLLQRAVEDPQQLRLRQIEKREWCALLYCVLWHEGDPREQLPGVPLVEPWRVRPLAGMLRLAEALDCSENSAVAQIRVLRAPSWLRLLVRPARSCDHEIAAAQKSSDILAEAIDLRIVIQQVVEEAAPQKRT